MSTAILLATKDRITPTDNPQLNASISAAALSIVLKAGHGAWLPQPYNGAATSGGTATTLNSTGVLAAIGAGSVGKFIRNVTDGSTAKITAVGTNSVTTTPLYGGTDNLWDNADVWRIDEFVLTLAKVNASGTITQAEECLITARSTDTLTVATGGRGYNSSTANTFDADDYAYLFVTSPIIERLKDYIGDLVSRLQTDETNITTLQTDMTAQQTGSYHYVVTTGSANAYVAATPALAAYAAGNLIVFKANFTNTGSATINLNSLGAKTIKKNDGATNLAANDIISGQIVVVRYDGTNFQMLSPVGTPATTTFYTKVVYLGAGASSAVTGTADANFDTHTFTIPANDLVAGVAYRMTGHFFSDVAAALTFSLKLGSTAIDTTAITVAINTAGEFVAEVFGTAAAGASVAVNGALSLTYGNGSSARDVSGGVAGATMPTANVATNGTLVLQLSVAKGSSGSVWIMGVPIEKISTTAFA